MTTLTVWRVEDHEGNGECQRCGRTGLRWVTYLSDGSRVGGECVKRLMGWAPTAKNFSWLTGMTLVAEADSCGDRFTLWRSGRGGYGVVARNGIAQVSGSFDWAQSEFTRLGA